MQKLEIFKAISEIVVSIGVGSLVGNTIKMTTDPEAGKFKKVAIGIGGFVISNMVSDLATKYTSERIDDAAVRVKNLLQPGPQDEDIKEGPTEQEDMILPSDGEPDNEES